jgi:phosphatidate cytidylyltransferase
MPAGELTKRVIVAAIGIPLVVVALVAGRWVMGPVLALFCAGAALEFYRLAERHQIRPLRLAGATAAAILVLIPTVWPTVAAAAPLLWTAAVSFTLLIALLAIWTRGPQGRPLIAIAVTLLGALLPAAAMGFAIFLRHLPVTPPGPVTDFWITSVGVALVAFALAVTWITDTAAYFAGSRWGRRKLIPAVSPNKTVVGAVAGLAGGLVAGWAVGFLALRLWLGLPLHPLAAAGAGLVVSALSQAGDLAASVWKREAGVKDSGTFFPGHGGIIDRMDSLLFTIPGTYWLLAWLVGGGVAW